MNITRRKTLGMLVGAFGSFFFGVPDINTGSSSISGAGISVLEQIVAGEEAYAAPSRTEKKEKAPARKSGKSKTVPATAKSARQRPQRHIPESPDVFIARSYQPPQDNEYWQRLKQGTLAFLHKRYGDGHWYGKKRLSDVNIEERIRWALHWVRHGVQEHAAIYPVDPLLIVAQMHEESRFYEFAISPVGAAGIAQFIPYSAKERGMRIAGKAAAKGYKAAGFADAYERFVKARTKRRNMKKAVLDEEDLPLALQDMKRMTDEEKQHLSNYRRFLEANLEGRDIFNQKDIAFINAFDQRFGYRNAVPAMVQYMAENLRRTDGYVKASLMGYNAGMGHVAKKNGRIPHIWSSVNYAENIVFTYRAIARQANAWEPGKQSEQARLASRR